MVHHYLVPYVCANLKDLIRKGFKKKVGIFHRYSQQLNENISDVHNFRCSLFPQFRSEMMTRVFLVHF